MSPDAAFGFNSSANMSPPLVVVSDPAVTPLRWFLVEMVGTDDSDDNLKRWSSFIGICIAISGNVLISLALNIQKLSHTRLEREEEHRRENRLKQRRLAAEEHRVLDGEETLVEDEEEEEEDEEEDDEEPLLSRSVSTSKILKRPRQQRANNTLDGPPETPARHSEKDDELGMSNVSYISSPYWWLGLVLMFFGECGNFLAYG